MVKMDLYRYFHPHYSPRLKNTPLRLQELAELELAAQELKRALERAEMRVKKNPVVAGITGDHFSEILVAANYLADSLATVANAHPGDSEETMLEMIKERSESPGWESWVRLLKQRLNGSNNRSVIQTE